MIAHLHVRLDFGDHEAHVDATYDTTQGWPTLTVVKCRWDIGDSPIFPRVGGRRFMQAFERKLGLPPNTLPTHKVTL